MTDLVVGRWGARFGARRLPCAVGRGGIGAKRAEGDGVTPAGSHRIEAVLYRPDRLRISRKGEHPAVGTMVARAAGTPCCETPLLRHLPRHGARLPGRAHLPGGFSEGGNAGVRLPGGRQAHAVLAHGWGNSRGSAKPDAKQSGRPGSGASTKTYECPKPDRGRRSGTARPIGPADAWSDDPRDPAYNRPVRRPHRFGTEALRRADRQYDLVAVLDWNRAPVLPGRGSAIFLHVWRGPRHPTAGCVAFRRRDLAFLLARWTRRSRVVIRG